jgi:hypothetical protein
MAPTISSQVPERTALNQQLLNFAYLQILDLMTTVAFLVHGVQEGNPLVRFLITRLQDPLSALVVVKVVAMMLGIFCWRTRRTRLLSRMNVMFAIIVAWNLVALILGSKNGG